MAVSDDREAPMTIPQEMFALFVEGGDCDALTDILVSSLEDTLRILEDEIGRGTIH